MTAFAYLSQFRQDARVAAARAAICVERWRASGNPIPDRVEDLPEAIRAAWPVDPFSNDPIRYRKLSLGYVTYSVGMNLRDDGGVNEADEWGEHHRWGSPDASFRVAD